MWSGDDAAELERYRKDEAAGLLLRLPAPIGSTVWRVRQNPACHYGVREAEKFLFGRVVTPRRIVEPVPFTLLLLDEWGRTVFLTKHEADKMLGKEEDTRIDFDWKIDDTSAAAEKILVSMRYNAHEDGVVLQVCNNYNDASPRGRRRR